MLKKEQVLNMAFDMFEKSKPNKDTPNPFKQGALPELEIIIDIFCDELQGMGRTMAHQNILINKFRAENKMNTEK